MKKIKTGADKLIDIIQDSKRISLENASKALGVNKDLVREWGEFLEKERLISIDYSFSKIFFTERKLSSGEIKESAKEIIHEKDAFVNKVEYAISSLEKEYVNFADIKKKFNDVQKGIKKELETVEHELKELEKYNTLKSNVDKEILAQKNEYKKEIDILISEVKDKEEEFVKIYTKAVKEKEDIIEHQKRLDTFEKSHKDLSKTIKSANDVLHKLKDDLNHERLTLKDKIDSFDKLKDEFEKLSNKTMKDKEKKIDNLLYSIDKESSKLLEKQKKLFSDAHKKVSKLENYENLSKKIKGSFEGFFSKTIDISKKMEEIDIDKKELEKNLLSIRNKAKALKIMSSNSALKKQAQEIEAQIKKQEEVKSKLFKKIRSLLDDLKV